VIGAIVGIALAGGGSSKPKPVVIETTAAAAPPTTTAVPTVGPEPNLLPVKAVFDPPSESSRAASPLSRTAGR
jgi:hypothetical protein